MRRWSYASRNINDIRKVRVTSVDIDGHAWITYNGKRSKEQLANLFVCKEDIESAVAFEQEQTKAVKARWASIPRWEPKP